MLGQIGLAALVLLACVAAQGRALAQDLEPRRWTHLPVGTNVGGLTLAWGAGDIAFDPLLEIEDGQVDVRGVVASYARSFDCFGQTGRIDLILPYQAARWEGLLSGTPATRRAEGLADPWVRLSVDFMGAPALEGEEFLEYRAANPIRTVVGAALAVMLPLGEYEEDKLLNLGQNRFAFRPQVGVLHTRESWSYELTGSVFLFTDNDEFLGGNEREQAPLYALQAHVIHTFPNRWWASLSAGYGRGGESVVNGVAKDDERGNLLGGVSVGIPLGESQGLRLVYLRSEAQERVGSDTDNLLLSWTVRF